MGSGPGIAAMILGIIASILYWILFPTLLFMGFGARGTSGILLIILGGLFALVAIVLAVVGLILGIVGAASDEKKAFSIVGLVLCAIIIFFTALLFLGIFSIFEPLVR